MAVKAICCMVTWPSAVWIMCDVLVACVVQSGKLCNDCDNEGAVLNY